jgi:four helix bundle protein
MGGFEELVVWQRAHELMLLIHRQVVPLLPRWERWDLCDQIRRSSKSIGANIAEGHGRYYFADTVRFCYVARGSLQETENHLRAARDLEYLSDDLYAETRKLADVVRRVLNGYISHLKRSKPGQNEVGRDEGGADVVD